MFAYARPRRERLFRVKAARAARRLSVAELACGAAGAEEHDLIPAVVVGVDR
jgi:hypothetical protein